MSASAGTCSSCGAALADGDRFCRTCGQAVTTAPPPAGPPPTTDWTAPIGGPAITPPAEPITPPAEPITPPAEPPTTDWTAPIGGTPITPPAVPPPTTDWTAPIGGPAYARSGSGSGVGAAFGRAAKGAGRGILGCFTIVVALGILGGVLASLEGPGATARPQRSAVVGTPGLGTPGLEPTVQPLEPEPTLLRIELGAAVDAGLVEMAADGMNLQELALGLDSLADEPLEVVVSAGLVFRPGASGTQAMVVITETSVALEPDEHVDVVLDVACASMLKDTPGSSDHFTLSATPASANLRKLVATPGFAAADFRVQQFAIWTITNDPTRDGYVGLGTGGAGSGPSDEEFDEIFALFDEADIEMGDYRAFR